MIRNKFLVFLLLCALTLSLDGCGAQPEAAQPAPTAAALRRAPAQAGRASF